MAKVPDDEMIGSMTRPIRPHVLDAEAGTLNVSAKSADKVGKRKLTPTEALKIQREAELKIKRAERLQQTSKRMKGFINHLIIAVCVLAPAVGLNIMMAPDAPWYLVLLAVWGIVIALHAAYATGLFGGKT